VDFEAEVVIQAEKSNIAVAAEDGRNGHVPGGFQALLEPLVNPRGMRGLRPPAGTNPSSEANLGSYPAVQ
jgi:hypothetical protein